jgi:protein-disulfide isomerase
VIVPLFALANAGIPLDGDALSAAASSPVTIGIVLAFLVGKPVGNLVAVWIATRPALGGARLTITWPALIGGALSGGVGFTVSLLVASLAFKDGPLLDQAKIGLLITALASPLLAWVAFRVMSRLPEEMRARQLGNLVDTIIDLADDIDPERDHVRGNPNAPVTLLEYGDFECPFCGQAEGRIQHMLAHLGDEMRFVFRHLPLTDVHPGAQLAAEASEAAHEQGAFWEMHDRLMAHQDELTPTDLYDHAAQLGLDLERFSEDLRRRRYAPRIAEDVQSADASGVSGTPSFFINGRRHEGVYDEATLTQAVKVAAKGARVAGRIARGGAGADPEAGDDALPPEPTRGGG